MRPDNPTTPGKGATAFVLTPAALSAVIEGHARHGAAFRLPLLRAALAGDLRLMEVTPGGRVPSALLDHAEPATAICLHDDGTFPAPGPDAFPQARRLFAWSGFTLLHATGGLEWHYRLAVEAAAMHRRVLIVETGSANEVAWCAILDAEKARRKRAGMPPARGLRLTVNPGGVHPVEARP